MPAISGMLGTASVGGASLEVDSWSVDMSCTVHRYATTATTDDQTNALAGRQVHTCHVEGVMAGGSLPATPGTTISVALGVTGGVALGGQGVVSKVSVPPVDISEGAPVRWAIDFEVDGILS